MTAFAPRDLFTADYLSKLCGQKTELVTSGSEGDRGGSVSYAPQGFPLLRPEQIRAMPAGHMLCFVDPVKFPFMARASGYWDTAFNGGLDPNPYYQK